MRRAWIVLATMLTVSGLGVIGLGAAGLGVGPAGAKTSKPVTIDGKVNVKGTKDVSAKKKSGIEIEADDYYFAPTFVKVQPDEKVTVELSNEGNATHTFTSDSLHIDKQVPAGKKAKFTITVPSDGTAFAFHCDFHQDMGMQGAFFTEAGGKAS